MKWLNNFRLLKMVALNGSKNQICKLEQLGNSCSTLKLTQKLFCALKIFAQRKIYISNK